MSADPAGHDVVVVGSGVNGLACAALLTQAGRNVCVLERNGWFGGAIRNGDAERGIAVCGNLA